MEPHTLIPLTQYKNTFLNILERITGLKPPNLQLHEEDNKDKRLTDEQIFWNSLYLPKINQNEPLFSITESQSQTIPASETQSCTWKLNDYYLYKAIYTLHFYIVNEINEDVKYDFLYEHKNQSDSTIYLYYLAKKKFFILKEVLNNLFLPNSFKHEYLMYFSKAQKHYAALSRFAQICKFKMAKITCNTDMYMNELDTKDPKHFAILQYNTKYYFTMCDLKRIIDTALTNLSYFYIEILPIRNPYNNMEFKYFELIQIYFFMKKHQYKVSHLFELFYDANMDDSVFEYDNESYIKTIGIHNYAFCSSYENLYEDIQPMLLVNYTYTKRLRIHDDYPRDKLVDIFRPYLHLFYLYKYFIHGSSKAFESKRRLVIKLKRFVLFNPQFGRKYIHKNSSKFFLFKEKENDKYKETFNSKHIPFNDMEEIIEQNNEYCFYVDNAHNDEEDYEQDNEDVNEDNNEDNNEDDGNIDFSRIFNSRFDINVNTTHLRFHT
jgi:hypothetical protein